MTVASIIIRLTLTTVWECFCAWVRFLSFYHQYLDTAVFMSWRTKPLLHTIHRGYIGELCTDWYNTTSVLWFFNLSVLLIFSFYWLIWLGRINTHKTLLYSNCTGQSNGVSDSAEQLKFLTHYQHWYWIITSNTSLSIKHHLHLSINTTAC